MLPFIVTHTHSNSTAQYYAECGLRAFPFVLREFVPFRDKVITFAKNSALNLLKMACKKKMRLDEIFLLKNLVVSKILFTFAT